MNGYTIDAIVEISISCQMNNYTTGCAARELYMRAPLAGLPLVCREYLKEASRCTIQAAFDVAFDEPLGTCPGLADLVQGRVASPFRSESVAVCGELWFIIGFQNGAYYVLYHFI